MTKIVYYVSFHAFFFLENLSRYELSFFDTRQDLKTLVQELHIIQNIIQQHSLVDWKGLRALQVVLHLNQSEFSDREVRRLEFQHLK